MGSQIFGSQKYLKKILGPKKFECENILVKKNWVPKYCLVRKQAQSADRCVRVDFFVFLVAFFEFFAFYAFLIYLILLLFFILKNVFHVFQTLFYRVLVLCGFWCCEGFKNLTFAFLILCIFSMFLAHAVGVATTTTCCV